MPRAHFDGSCSCPWQHPKDPFWICMHLTLTSQTDQVLQAFRFSPWPTPIGAGNSRSARLTTPPRLYLIFDQPKRRDQGVASWPPPKHMSKTDSVTSVASMMEPCYWRDDFYLMSSIQESVVWDSSGRPGHPITSHSLIPLRATVV